MEAETLGSPNGKGEYVMVTDASDIGGGAVLMQWQCLDPLQVHDIFSTKGVLPDGSLKSDYPHPFIWSQLVIGIGSGARPELNITSGSWKCFLVF